MSCSNQTQTDISSPDGNTKWAYSDIVKDHFFNPRNFVKDEDEIADYDAHGQYGSPACGDEMHVWIKVDPKTKRIIGFKWRTFGCASAIAATSVASEIVTEQGGMSLEEAMKLKPQAILERLGGLPDRKIHCSVLCDKALQEAIKSYQSKSEA